jgi:hypothetical protein
MIRRFVQLSAALALALALTAAAVYLWRQHPDIEHADLIDQRAFRCYAVGESMRTIGYTRVQRKQTQLKRIERLLQEELDDLDAAKLRAERAILAWEIADAEYQRACAEAWFEPGSTKARPSFPEAPRPFRAPLVRAAFEEALAQSSPRLLPHGFDERAALHLSELALDRGDHREAARIARAHLEAQPEGLYVDALRLTLADAALAGGDLGESLSLYQEVGRLPIGFEAHYARYREAMIHRLQGREEQAQALLRDVLQWAKRGDRAALRLLLEGQPLPPPPPPEV